ncbi:PulJ/GspJ family protein [Janthinobacterium fluminis]|uniref:Type II secretion system protein n=1 Tax=Janthinobacterium fluminis TaxID=2987524 RepID=A0ABT5K5Z0_9BURK|nr:type II secretion system protein [Janthinobacterium fluminis]MDC8760398.1 type II secretion system protein [Janthinobacterium fluminis]
MTPARCKARRQRGFTLVEAVLVMVITGILAGVVAMFIRMPVRNYVDSVARAELSDAADTALRRIARDVRRSLPNSLRIVNGNALELLLTKTGGRYLSAQDEANFAPGVVAPVLSFSDPVALAFSVVGPMPTGTRAIAAGDAVVVYNLGPDVAEADAYAGSNRATVAQVAGNTITMAGAVNPFAGRSESPGRRFQVVTTPVTYFCQGGAGGTGTLTRIADYPIAAAQANPGPPAGLSGRLANNVLACAFNFTALANTHSGLLTLTITLQRGDVGDSPVTLSHQIHVDNTP